MSHETLGKAISTSLCLSFFHLHDGAVTALAHRLWGSIKGVNMFKLIRTALAYLQGCLHSPSLPPGVFYMRFLRSIDCAGFQPFG